MFFQQMRRLLDWIEDEQEHKGKSMLVLAVIAHGDSNEWLMSAERERSWRVPDLITSMCDNKSLVGQPKVLFLQACRGGKYMYIVVL